MKIIYIRGGDKESPGVLAVKHHLEERGHKVVRDKESLHDVIFCWGCSTRDLLKNVKPTINGRVNFYDKFEAMLRFKDMGVRVPEILNRTSAARLLDLEKLNLYPFPWFSRKLEHEKGKDIQVIKTTRALEEDLDSRRGDFYSVFVPNDMEIRVWVFNGKVFAVYKKEYRQHGLENFKNLEWRSELRDDLMADKDVENAAILAVKALKMEFGAVDIIHGTDGRWYTLEVNSQPDISSLIRVSGVRLAKLISEWGAKQ